MKKIILLYTYSDNPVKPGDNIYPGRRDYTWTVDTLNIPFITLQRILGKNSKDIVLFGLRI